MTGPEAGPCTMDATAFPALRDQLLERRQRLETAARSPFGADEADRLLREVDAALERMTAGTFGICETCGDPVETDRLLADPLTRFCIDHLTTGEQRALERDIELAGRIQRELLPRIDGRLDGWQVAYRYEPAGPVSGDFCDLIATDTTAVHFLVGDVAGKGIAAALVMSHLSALFRTLIALGLPMNDLVERANRLFCESTLPEKYATLVCARADTSGVVEIANAGHPPPLIVHSTGVSRVDATGVPIGMFCSSRYATHAVTLDAGDTLLLYSDGVIEALNEQDEEYGIDRLASTAAAAAQSDPQALIDTCLRNVAAFRGLAPKNDDVTMMAVRRA